MIEHVDYVVAGLGALGSATAMELAGRGHRVVGLERFELGHDHGASHDTSRILRHSYHTPAYVRLTQEAYADWARLEHDSGEELVSVVGGLDLFPPDPGISPVEYVESMDAVGIDYDVLDVGTGRGALAAVRAARGHAPSSTSATRRSCPPVAGPAPCRSSPRAVARTCGRARR